MSRPTRPTNPPIWERDVMDAEQWEAECDERDAYITALEREREEALKLLRRWEAGPMLEDRAALHQETDLFLARIEGGNNG